MLVYGLKLATQLIIFVLLDVVTFGDLLAVVKNVFDRLSFVLYVVFDKLVCICGSSNSLFFQQLLLPSILNVSSNRIYIVVKLCLFILAVRQITIFIIQFLINSHDFLFVLSQFFLLILNVTTKLRILLLKQKQLLFLLSDFGCELFAFALLELFIFPGFEKFFFVDFEILKHLLLSLFQHLDILLLFPRHLYLTSDEVLEFNHLFFTAPKYIFDIPDFFFDIFGGSSMEFVLPMEVFNLIRETVLNNLLLLKLIRVNMPLPSFLRLKDSIGRFNLQQLFSFGYVGCLTMLVFMDLRSKFFCIHFLFEICHDLQLIHIFEFEWLLEMPVIVIFSCQIESHSVLFL